MTENEFDWNAAALASERLVRGVSGSFIDLGDCEVFRSRVYTDWFDGNGIDIRNPGARSLDEWESLFDEYFDASLYRHRTFLVSPGDAGSELVRRARARGYQTSRYAFMVASEAGTAPQIPTGYELRRIDRDKDEDTLIELACNEDRDSAFFVDDATTARFQKGLLDRSDEIGVEWWGLWQGDTLAAKLGVFRHDELCRLQEVATGRMHRRRGLASALVQHALNRSLQEDGVRGLALVADYEGGARTLYERSGFREAGETWHLHRMRSDVHRSG